MSLQELYSHCSYPLIIARKKWPQEYLRRIKKSVYVSETMMDVLSKEGVGKALLVDCRTAAGLIGVGLSTFYAMDRSGELGPQGVRLRRRRLWPREELVAWVRAGCPPREAWVAMSEV